MSLHLTSLKMPICVVGFGTATTSTFFDRKSIMDRIKSAYNSDKNSDNDHEVEINFYDRLTKATQIKTRSVCDNALNLEKEFNHQIPYYHKMKLWYEYAQELASKSCEEAINDYVSNNNGSVKDITHVICHSVTGWRLPGLTHFIINKFNLSSSTRPVEANFAGCYGGAHLIYLATSIINMDKNAVVLICDTEIMDAMCAYPNVSFNASLDHNKGEYIPLSLFGTGSGCLIIKQLSIFELCKTTLFTNNKNKLWEIESQHQRSHIIPNSNDDVICDWKMNECNNITSNSLKLSSKLSHKFENALNEHLNKWLTDIYGRNNVDLSNIDVAMHCGGIKVLNIVKTFFIKHFGNEDSKIDDNLLKDSFDLYEKYGNQSAASILFVLKDVCHNTKKDNIFFIVFGIGITVQIGSL